jgi:putative ABC transport system permease protein
MIKTKKKPPAFAAWILARTIRSEDRLSILSDFSEIYKELAKEQGNLIACRWYWAQVVRSIPIFILNILYWRFIMFKSYLKMTFRIFRRHKVFSFINIVGLSLGMTACILILLWVRSELSFDRFHKNADRIFRVVRVWPTENAYGPEGPGTLGPVLEANYPEIINMTRLFPPPERPLRYVDKAFHVKALGVDPSFLDIFSFPLVRGNYQTAFEDPNFILLTEKTAKKYFGDEDPIGKVMRYEWWSRWLEFQVTGIIENVPSNSHLQFEALIPFDFVTASGMTIDTWDAIAYHAYVQLEENTDYKVLDTKISGVMKKYSPDSTAEIHLEPLTRIHLYDYFRGGPITYVYIFSIIGVLILIIACINFMNLSTARSMTRAKEVGIRKVIGSSRRQLIQQFFGESIMLSLLALGMASVLAKLLLPAVNRVIGTSINAQFSPSIISLLIGSAVLTGLVAGSYPAFLLSGFQPVSSIKGRDQLTSKRSSLRRILVISQFVISIVLIICVIFIYRQLDFIRNRELGFQKTHVLSLTMGGSFWEKYQTIKNELLSNPRIQSLTQTNFSFPSGYGTDHVWWEGKEDNENVFMSIRSVDFDFQKTFDAEMVEGRFFSRDFPTDVKESFILNEKAVEFMGLESPVGKAFSCQIPFAEGKGKIIGVVKDFHFQSLHREIQPLIVMFHPYWLSHCYIKISSEDIPATLAFIDSKLKEFVPEFPFELGFLEEDIDRLYGTEQRIGTLVRYGTILAVFVACLGLFGLATFNAEQRTKEIGIRKVLGASVSGIVFLFSKEFARWVLLANAIAWPISYFVMRKWMQAFAYRTPLAWEVFVLSAGLALMIALLTVSFQAVKAATSNPVDSLRYE